MLKPTITISSLLSICFFLISCSSTNVYLYQRYLTTEQSQTITQTLEKAGYHVETNNLAFPDDVDSSTVLYSPFLTQTSNQNKPLDDLVEIINRLGFTNLTLQSLYKDNHLYSNNSIGLMLIPHGVIRNDILTTDDLANQYNSEQCRKKEHVTLTLNSDNSYQLIYQQKPTNIQEHLSGQWQITSYPYLELISANKTFHFYFEITKSERVDLISNINTLILKPLNTHHVYPNCNFVYGMRS